MEKEKSGLSNMEIKDLMKVLTDKLEKQHTSQNQIKREGSFLIVPQFMSYQEAANALVEWQETMETETQKDIEVQGHPSDLLMAFYNATRKSFGNVIGDMSVVSSFFGTMRIPGKSKTVQYDFDKKMSVPYGKISIPGLPISINIEVSEDRDEMIKSWLTVTLRYRKKYEPLAEMIEQGINEELKQNSIFMGKAIDSKWNFVNLNGFPLERIAYSDSEREQLFAHVFRLIKSTAIARAKGVSIKRTILLHGRYGTGKTLTALLAANICVSNGWTFMNVQPGDSITSALEFAKRFQPCMVFFEDIDQVTDGGRDSEINGILNTIDGLLSKAAEVMTILTTNHPEKIERAMLRPGRIDAVIEMGRIDRNSLKVLIDNYLGEQIVQPLAIDYLLEAAKDYTPAFIAEACNRAMLFALERTGGKENGKGITTEDIHKALMGLRSQYELMVGKQVVSEVTIDDHIRKCVEKGVSDVNEVVKTLQQDVAYVRKQF